MSGYNRFETYTDYTFAQLLGDEPLFTQKHYVAIANVIHAQRLAKKANPAKTELAAEAELCAINEMTLALSKLFKEDNPKFKEFTFIEACNRDLKE